MTKLNRGAVQMTIRRVRKGLTKAALAARVGMHPSDIGKAEAGERLPTRRVSIAIKGELGVQVEWWDEAPLPEDLRELREQLGDAARA